MIAPVKFLTPKEQRAFNLYLLEKGVEGIKKDLLEKGWSEKTASSLAKAMYKGVKK